ncbi:30S ribosomal protein S16 [Algiphilus aromaticivorans]|jgi:small subunit ribosomal protein S16|uniref:30S ribosomal protein S16 n=1 Tax=Algiphilus aromaticivorans TaxID=382454 RepID=UPI0005C1B43F|nr:30S ribosomal protein S16 [Algiphilus aromaticivorans]
MVKIRLSRAGTKKRPFYHIVATDSRNRRDGRFIERLGFFNPSATGGDKEVVLDKEKLEAWRVKGAQVSERVVSLARKASDSVAAESAAA